MYGTHNGVITPDPRDTGPLRDLLVIGFDTEYVMLPNSDRNHVLSYQYAGKTSAGSWTGIIYTKGPEQKHRLNLRDLVGIAIEAGRDEGILPRQWPSVVYATAHFSRADISSFRDFSNLKVLFDHIRGTYVTLNRPYRCRCRDNNHRYQDLEIHLRDTATISPAGSKLAALGELHGLAKLDLPIEMLSQMDVLLKQDPDLFERYAIRDAEIAALHAWAMAEFSVANGLGNAPPVTLGSLSVRHLQNLWAREGVSQNAVLGQERITEQPFNPQTGQFRTVHRDVPITAVHDHTTLATECYHGGRNEAFVFGFSDTDNWYDFDLSGAYSTAMAAIRMPDWANIRVDLNAASYTADVMGLARLRFKFPADIRFPCLPMRSDNGLIFPLEGESYAGSPEIQLALDMGAEIEIEHGVIVPWLNDTKPIELFSRSVRQQREAQQKGSVYERTWKEIGNSVYGKLAQGLQEKRVYDSRTDRSQILPPSQITQAFLAAYTTSIVRAVLGELLHRCLTSDT